MAKKKKGGKGGGKKGGAPKEPVMIDGTCQEDMSKEQLMEHIARQREELEREREERNYFQLERDKVSTFWEITRRQLENSKASLRNKAREMEDAEERHQVEIKVYKQKVKHLLYENQQNIAEVRGEAAAQLNLLVGIRDLSLLELKGLVSGATARKDLKPVLFITRCSP